jgi:hypothetical protein
MLYYVSFMSNVLEGKSLKELQAIRSHLVRQLKRIGPDMIEGSVTVIRVTCGNPRCRCTRGEKHEKTILTRKVDGKTRSTYVPVELVDEVRRWNEQYKRARELLKEIAEVTEVIVRGHGRRQRAKKKAESQLRLLDP